jgi:hypothetical protein
MKTSVIRLGGLAVLLSCSMAMGSAAPLVLIVRPGGNSWAFYEAEKVNVNQHDRLRSGFVTKTALLPDDYKKFPAEPILRIGLMRWHAGGYLVRRSGDNWQAVLPDGESLKSGATTCADLWKSAAVTYQSDRNAKSLTPLKSGDMLYAILPGPDRDQAIVDFIFEQANFKGVGEKNDDAAFSERMSLLAYAAQKVQGPPAEKLQQILLSRMEEANQKVGSGIAHTSDLTDGLKYADVSKVAYPDEPRQKRLRDALANTKASLDRQVAILRAFAEGGWWDDFLLKYGEFDRWRNSFPDIAKEKEKAFSESAREHMALGKQHEEAKRWALALHEYQTAQGLDPNSKALDQLILGVKASDIAENCKPVAIDLKSQPQRMITNYLSDVALAIQDNKLEDAERELALAEAQEKTSTRVLFYRADLLRAKKEFQAALGLLDDYDRRACNDDEIAKSSQLRSKTLSEFRNDREKLKAAIEKAKTDGDYKAAVDRALEGIILDPQDPDFLHAAALGSALLRKNADAARYMKEYIKRLSLTPGVGDKLIGQAFDEERLMATAARQPQGEPNWFSGYSSLPGVFYCPISLMPNPRIAEVKTSPKQTTTFNWAGDKLAQVETRDPESAANDSTLLFDYFKNRNAVRRVAKVTRATKERPDPKEEPSRLLYTEGRTLPEPDKQTWSYFTLWNNPEVDPLLVARLMSKQITTLVAGNPYFHPFVWNGVYEFHVEYDDLGRVKSAKQLTSGGPAGDTGLHNFEFQWDGVNLTKISEVGTGSYQRVMRYAGGSGSKLLSETVTFNGKTSEIKYNWSGDRLTAARSGEDASVSGRSRDVTFH